MIYKCKKCSSIIDSNTFKKLVFCKCGKIGVDGTFVNARIVGDKKYLVKLDKKKEYTYRLKQVETGLYFRPYKYPNSAGFFKIGKFYSRKPCLSWAHGFGECVIEKYELLIDTT